MGAEGVPGPVVALTGTPGTGKSTVARHLRDSGQAVLELARFVGDARFDLGADEDHHRAVTIDQDALSDHLRGHLAQEVGGRVTGAVFLDSHFSHELDIVDRILVLRCAPSVLAGRLAARDWPPAKVRENVEAEAIDLIVQEALEVQAAAAEAGDDVAVGEVDTTHLSATDAARRVLELAIGPADKLEIGTVDWSGEVLGWY